MVGRAGEPKGSPGPFQPVVPTLYVSPPDDWNLTVVINLTEKVNPMTAITAETLSPILHNQIPVITTELLAQLYGAEVNNIQQNFKRNAERFVAGKHFFKLEGNDLREFKNRLTDSQLVAKHSRSLILWTERGAARHAKMLETDQAWEVFEKLEDCYFCQTMKSLPAVENSLALPSVSTFELAGLASDAATGMDKAMELWNQKICPELSRANQDLSTRMFFALMDSYRPLVSLRWALLKTAGFPRA